MIMTISLGVYFVLFVKIAFMYVLLQVDKKRVFLYLIDS